jgi:hypothetical protein
MEVARLLFPSSCNPVLGTILCWEETHTSRVDRTPIYSHTPKKGYRRTELFVSQDRGKHGELSTAPAENASTGVAMSFPIQWNEPFWIGHDQAMACSTIRPSAHQKELNIINPDLPEWLAYLRIRNLRIGNSRVGLDFPSSRADLL